MQHSARVLQISDSDLAVIGQVLRASNSLVTEETTPYSRTRTWHGSFPPPPGAPGGGMGSRIDSFFEAQVESGLAEALDLMQQHMRHMFGGEGSPGEPGGFGGSGGFGGVPVPDGSPDRMQVGDALSGTDLTLPTVWLTCMYGCPQGLRLHTRLFGK